MAATLPKFIGIKSTKGHAYYKKDGASSVGVGEANVLSTLVKIAVEPATSNDKYVHLRFYFFNRYLQQKADDNNYFIVAESDQPDEDTTKSSFTLFEPIVVDSKGKYYLKHVQSGGRVVVDESTTTLRVKPNPTGGQEGHLTFVNLETLIKLPTRVAFIGYDNYLKAFNHVKNYLKFMAAGAKEHDYANHTVSQMPDGHVRIKSDHFLKFWRRSGDSTKNWIWCDSSATTATDINTMFWPVKHDGSNIALKNAGNNKFCKHLITTDKLLTNCLSAADSSITESSRLQLEELVAERKISNVRYQMEYARIVETPHLYSHTVTNKRETSHENHTVITFNEEHPYTFERTLSFQAGVSTTIDADAPFIGDGGSISTDHHISEALEWGKRRVHCKKVEYTTTFTVPPMCMVAYRYDGTKGTCTIPFFYTQHDHGSAQPIEMYDGIYTATSFYDFKFSLGQILPIH